MDIIKKIKQWYCGRKYGHKYVKHWRRWEDKPGGRYVRECVNCGKRMGEE